MAENEKATELALRAIDLHRQLVRLREQGPQRTRIPMSLLYSFFNDAQTALPDDFDAQLRADPRARRDLDALSRKQARAEIGAAIAASTPIDRRMSDAVILEVRSSTAVPGEVAVTVEFRAPKESPARLLVVVDAEDNWHRLALQPYEGSVSQGLSDETAPIVRALRDPKSRIRVR